MNGLWQDVVNAARLWRKHSRFAAVAIVTLAVGIGAATAVFSLANGVMLRRLPVRDPERLVLLKWSAHEPPKTTSMMGWPGCPQGDRGSPGADGCWLSTPLFEQLRAERRAFSDAAAFMPTWRLSAPVQGRAGIVAGDFVSGTFFSTLGVRSSLGRVIAPSDDAPNAAPAVVLSYGYWRRQFGGDPSVLGRTLHVTGTPFTVIGVAASEFSGLDPGFPRDMWLPLATRPLIESSTPSGSDAKALWLMTIARLAPGTSIKSAETIANSAFLRHVTSKDVGLFVPENAPHLRLLPADRGLASARDSFAPLLLLLGVAVSIVLLTACANVAGLLIARIPERQREMALRFALGAGRLRVMRQLLTESLVLAVVAGLLGIAIAYAGARALAASVAQNAPIPMMMIDIRPDPRVLAFAAATAIFTGLAFGMAPAFRGARAALGMALQESAATFSRASAPRGRLSLGASLVVAQVALSLLVLASGALLIRSLANLQAVDVGFNPRNILVFMLDPPHAR